MNFTSTEILFEKFQIIDCIKRLNHSSVYIADHIFLGKKIFLKTLDIKDLTDKTILERFKREAKILASLEHPNIIKVLDFGTYTNHFYISFEYFESKNLREKLKENLNLEQKKSIVKQLISGLRNAHLNNITHRDLKPENILIDNNLKVKIADFGLAFTEDGLKLTIDSSILGTPSYMSPEQIQGEQINKASDIFSMGILIYELFTGVNPLLGKDLNETINNIINFNEAELEKMDLVPEEYRDVILSMLKHEPIDRITSEEVLKEISTGDDDEIQLKKTKSKKEFKLFTFFSSNVFIISFSVMVVVLLYYVIFIQKIDLPEYFANNSKAGTNNLLKAKENNESLINNASGDARINIAKGKVYIKISPESDIYINNKKVNHEFLYNGMEMTAGTYYLKIVNKDFPVVNRKFNITANNTERININLNQLWGYLQLNVFPWGDVYVNNKSYGQTPIREPIKLFSGVYNLVVKNPSFSDMTKKVRITPQKTLTISINFENSEK